MQGYRRILMIALSLGLSACVASVSDTQFFYRDPPERESAHVAGMQYSSVAYSCGTVSVASANLGAGEDLLLYFGGNQFRMADGAMPVAMAARQAGFARLVTFDYPGRGETTGDITPDCYQAASKAVAEYTRKSFGGRITAHGFSFGGLMVPYAAKPDTFDAIVLESTARSPESWLRAMAPPGARIKLPPSLVGYDSTKALEGVRVPMLVITGAADKTAGPKVAKDLADSLRGAGHQVRMLVIPGATHGTVFTSADARAAMVALRTSR